MNTYSEYQNTDFSLSFEEMLKIHNDLIAQATKYADYRANWMLWSNEKKTEADPNRSKCHDRLIDCFNILERYLKKIGKEASWRVYGRESASSYAHRRLCMFPCIYQRFKRKMIPSDFTKLLFFNISQSLTQ